MVLMNLFAGQEERHRRRQWTCGHSSGRKGWDKLREMHYALPSEPQRAYRYTTMCKIDS